MFFLKEDLAVEFDASAEEAETESTYARHWKSREKISFPLAVEVITLP